MMQRIFGCSKQISPTMIRHQSALLLRTFHCERRYISTLKQNITKDRILHSASASCGSDGLHHHHRYRQDHRQGQQVRFSSNDSHGTTQVNIIDETEKKTEKAAEEIDLSKFTKEIKIEMPEIVEGATAKVVKWYKEEGDIVYPDDTICDIETEMFTFGMDVGDECIGIMKEIVFAEGVEIHDSSSPICIILHEENEEQEK